MCKINTDEQKREHLIITMQTITTVSGDGPAGQSLEEIIGLDFP